MFTGLVEALGRIERVVEEGAGRRLTIAWPGLAEPLTLGESIAVNGCCLTVISTDADRFDVQAGPETLLRTNLGARRPGDAVNLERSLRVGDRLGGHFVQGHIDTTAVLRQRRTEGEWEFLAFGIDPAWTVLMVPKGSIAVDGVSLTLVDVAPDGFSVMLIPHTLSVTTLGRLAVGDRVNIEADMIAKHVAKLAGGQLAGGQLAGGQLAGGQLAGGQLAASSYQLSAREEQQAAGSGSSQARSPDSASGQGSTPFRLTADS